MKKTMRKIGLGGSIVALIVCLVLVTGSTFSLFTTKDENDITVNAAKVELAAVIDADSLKYYSKGVAQTEKFENGGTAEFTNDDKTLTLYNVTPGDKAEFNIVVTNSSTVDIQYRIKWTYTGELADALVTSVDGVALTSGTSEWAKWTPDEDDTKTLKLSVELPIDVKDDYQDKSATIDFYIEAVQANAVQGVNVTTADELYTSLEMNGVAVLANDITLDRPLVVNKNAELYLAGHTLTNENGDTVINNAKLTIYEGAPVVVYSLRRNAQNTASEAVIGSIVSGNGSAIVNNGTLIINGGSFVGTDAAAVSNTEEAKALLIETGSFASNIEEFAIEYAAAEKVTINGGEFTGALASEEIEKIAGEGVNATRNKDGNLVFAPVIITTVTTPDELLTAFANAQPGEVIDATGVTVDINSVGSDIVNGKFALTIKGDVTIRGLNVIGSYRGGNYFVFEGTADQEVVLENCTFEPSGSRTMGIGLQSINNGVGSVVCNNCTFKGPVMLEFVNNSATFNNCTFTKHTSGNNYVFAYGGTQTFNNCTFDYTGLTSSSMGTVNTASINVMSESDNSISTIVTLNGCTRINCGTHKYGSDSTLTIK